MARGQEGHPIQSPRLDQASLLRSQEQRSPGRLPGRQCRQEVQQATQDRQAKGISLREDYAHVHFRSRKNPSETIFIHASAISTKGVYHTLLGELKRREPIPHAHGDAKLTLRHHQYHLSVPFKRMGPHISESNLRPQTPDQVRVVALDPGVRNPSHGSRRTPAENSENRISDESRGCASTRTICCPVPRRRRQENGATCAGPLKE